MRTRTSAPRLLAVALIGFGLCSSAWAQETPRPRDPLPENLPDLTTPPEAQASPSTRLEVPGGSDIKITIEISSKPNPPAAPPVAAPPRVPAEPPAPPPPPPPPPSAARLPLPTMESIKPLPLPQIPNNPLPHEGAMIELPYPVEPPDLITIEVLEALPGRPVSGERLIHPDGMISLGFYGELYVRGLRPTQVKEKVILLMRKFIPDEVLGLVEQDENANWIDIEPRDSNRVFVDITAYNSKNYFIQGDVAAPGRLPWTGQETILDALNYCGGFIPTADPKNIHLVRPSRDGKPPRVYKVDYEAILDRGESEKNYQLFPGDRIVVGRNAVVKTTIELDRLAAPMQTVYSMIQKHSSAMKSLNDAAGGPDALTAVEREALVKGWADFWWQIATRPPGAKLDEKTFRESLMKSLKPPKAKKPGKKK